MSYKDRIFERHDVYDVLLYKSEDLYFGDREFYAEHVIGDAETAESDSDLGVSWNYDKMNTVVYGIFDKGMIIQVVRKVKPGDILVASMTIPEFVPAMERAAAFVTNEGGILCHAAIIAREMKKPCIIGTKIATRALRDGDIVEVNADKGIVTKQ